MTVHIENPVHQHGGAVTRSSYCGVPLRDALSRWLREDSATLQKSPDVTCVDRLTAFVGVTARRAALLSSAAQVAQE